MFDWVSEFYSNNSDFINGAGSTVSIVGALIGLSRFRNKSRKKIFYQWVRKDRIANDSHPRFLVDVKLDLKRGKSLITDVISISNRTDVTITDDDFVEPISIPRDPDKVVYCATAVTISNNSDAKIEIDDFCFKLTDLRIARHSTVTIYLSHDSATKKGFQTVLKSLPDPVETTFKHPSKSTFAELFSYSITVSPVIIAVVYMFSLDFESPDPSFVYIFGPATALSFFLIFFQKTTKRIIGGAMLPFSGLTSEELYLSTDDLIDDVEEHIFGRTEFTDNDQS